MTSIEALHARRDLLKAELLELNPQERPEWHERLFRLLIENETEIRSTRDGAAS